MPGGMFHLLPILKGWKWQSHSLQAQPLRAGPVIEQELSNEFGWAMFIGFTTTDEYCKFEISTAGSKLESRVIYYGRPIDCLVTGAFAQDPSGWGQRYLKTSSTSTAGIYVLCPYTGGAQGSPLPYLDKTKMRASLEAGSTQDSCLAFVSEFGIQIYDMNLFIQSLRAVYAIRNMKVDKSLLEYGSQTFAEGLI